MKQLIVTGVALMALVSGEAGAAPNCDANKKVSGSALTTLLSGTGAGNTVCAVRNGERWQEQHRSGGQLWDYKQGPTDAVDPTTQVGTWSTAANEVTYSYNGGSSYTYSIHEEGTGLYSFCTGGVVIVSGAEFRAGLTSCASAPP